jgi:HEAT repeat protein
VFLDALYSENEQLSYTASWVLGLIGWQETIEPLKELLKTEDANVRDAASFALALLGDQTQREAILNSLDKDDTVFRMVSVLFKAIRSSVDMEKTARLSIFSAVLLPYVGGRSFFQAGIQLLEALGELAPVELLVDALRDRDENVRMKAAEILGKLGVHAPADVLLAALGDSVQGVRRSAIKSLQQTHPDVISAIQPEASSVFLRGEPEPILGSLKLGTFLTFLRDIRRPSLSLFEKLKECLSWPYWEVRMMAAQTLAKLRRNIPDDVITRLTELRFDQEADAVRKAADEALAEILSLEPGTGIEDV